MAYCFLVNVAVVDGKSHAAVNSFTDEELVPTDVEHEALRGRYLPFIQLDAVENDAPRIPRLGGK